MESVAMSEEPSTTYEQPSKIFLNIGCGTEGAGRNRIPSTLKSTEWHEIRVDINPAVNPDIVATMKDLNQISNDSVDAIWSSHNLEHLCWHEVEQALLECKRVLKPEGFLIITLPDIEKVARLVTEGKILTPLYESPIGPITPLDMMYGHRASIAKGNLFMRHQTAFTTESLGNELLNAGFDHIRVIRGNFYDIWSMASMQPLDEKVLAEVKGLSQ